MGAFPSFAWAIPCHGLPCLALPMPCHALPCPAMACHAMLKAWHGKPWPKPKRGLSLVGAGAWCFPRPAKAGWKRMGMKRYLKKTGGFLNDYGNQVSKI